MIETRVVIRQILKWKTTAIYHVHVQILQLGKVVYLHFWRDRSFSITIHFSLLCHRDVTFLLVWRRPGDRHLANLNHSGSVLFTATMIKLPMVSQPLTQLVLSVVILSGSLFRHNSCALFSSTKFSVKLMQHRGIKYFDFLSKGTAKWFWTTARKEWRNCTHPESSSVPTDPRKDSCWPPKMANSLPAWAAMSPSWCIWMRWEQIHLHLATDLSTSKLIYLPQFLLKAAITEFWPPGGRKTHSGELFWILIIFCSCSYNEFVSVLWTI